MTSRTDVEDKVQAFEVGGVDFVTACDMRYCTEDAYFAIKEIDMGLVADIGTLQRLPGIITKGHVAELAYTGRDFGADYAKEIAATGAWEKAA